MPGCLRNRCARTLQRWSTCGALPWPWRRVLDVRGVGVEAPALQALARLGREASVARAVLLKALVVDLLEVEECIVGALGGADQLVQLELDRGRIAVLRVLDQKHHQKGDDRGAGVDH